MTTRRDLLLAGAGLAVAATVKSAPLTGGELRVLAMCATPKDAWAGREAEYGATRVVGESTETCRILRDLEERGLVARKDTPWRGDVDWYATATPAGVEELRRVGVRV